MLVLALHTAYLVGSGDRMRSRLATQMLLALAAYATYVINATQFLLKLRAARRAAPARPAGLIGARPMNALARPCAAAARSARVRRVLRERGQREVFCGLTGIIWLHRKIQDAFFLVVGSRTCAHLIQSAAGVMIFAEPRFATAIIDERDLAGLADANDELDRVVARLLERRPDIRLLFLVGSCPSEVIKLDLSRAAGRLSQKLSPQRARAQLFRQRHRDDVHAGRGRLPRLAGAASAAGGTCCRTVAADRRRARRCRRGSVPTALSRARASGRCTFFPPRRASDLPPVGPARAFLLAQPFLADTARALEERGAHRLSGALPARRRRHDAWLQAAASAWRRAGAVRARDDTRRAIARARCAVRAIADELAGKRVFFFPDSQLEVPLARFLSRELSMQLVEVGTPYLHRAASRRRTARCCRPAPC